MKCLSNTPVKTPNMLLTKLHLLISPVKIHSNFQNKEKETKKKVQLSEN